MYSKKAYEYSFESTKHLYEGIHDEHVPWDVMEIIVKDDIEIIGAFTFIEC